MNENILEKIKKLLRLARSANPHEANLAMQNAMKLAAEHQIAVEGINPDEQQAAITDQTSRGFIQLTYDRHFAALIVQRFFNVSVVIRPKIIVVDGWPKGGKALAFVGKQVDIDIALYVYVFLTRRFAYCWNHHRGRARNRRAFIEGMFRGIWAVLLEAQPPEEPHKPGLILAERDAYIRAHFGDTSAHKAPHSDKLAAAAAFAGFLHGRNTKIRTPLERPAETLRLA